MLRSATPLTIQFDWIANAQFAGVLVAKERGWYDEAGLDVRVSPLDPKTMTDSMGPVARDDHTVGVADGLVLLKARANHAPIRAFATMLQASPLCVMTLASGPIREFKDLRGRTIGLHAYDHEQLKLMLAHNHMGLGDVTAVDIGEDFSSLISGRIDAQVAYAIDEKVAVEQRGYPTRIFPGHENGFVAYSQVYYSTESLVRREPAALAAFLAATNRGWEEAFSRPREAADMIVERYLKGGDARYQEKSLEEIRRYATLETGRLGEMRLETWERSCAAFGLPRELAGELADFSILSRVR